MPSPSGRLTLLSRQKERCNSCSTVCDATILTGQNLWAEMKTILVMSSKRVHLQMEITEIQGFGSSLHPFSPTSALGSGSMHDMRQSVYGTYIVYNVPWTT